MISLLDVKNHGYFQDENALHLAQKTATGFHGDMVARVPKSLCWVVSTGILSPVVNPHPLEDSLNAPTRSPLTAELVNDISIPMDERVQQLEFSCRVGPHKPVCYDLHVVY